ncbi:MAG: PASTA domain-containing protein [Clostridiales Family XIII bacterium]|jgi:stage V sporulation protein D (sporulation-specific penicillin-binding protein)|nr:PASTA domain-containing protein [Clostridiales Family XIII bacterium]
MASRTRRVPAVGLPTIRRRVILAFAIVAIVFSVLAFRIGYIQVVATDQYASRAAENQIKDEVIPARRGDILDRNMKELAVSSESYTIYLRLKPYSGDKTDADVRKQKLDDAVVLLSDTLGLDKAEIESNMNTDSSRIRIARDVDKNKMDIIRKAMDERALTVIEVEEKSSRGYPLGAFASHVLGSVNNDGHGQAGIEQRYDSYLSGQSGRNIMNADAKGNPIYGNSGTTYDKKDGLNVVTTLDETIQYHVEDAIKTGYDTTKPARIEAIVMQPDTGDVLAMAKYPEYDPNEPYTPIEKSDTEEFEKLSAEEKSAYLSKMWRNTMVSDVYEPGSVFKLVTVSAALEEGAVNPGTGVVCNGVYQVNDRTIHCHVYPASHGWQTVEEAVGNSCNPGLIQIMQKMGYDKYSKYLDLFGVTQKTGIDLPAEAYALTQSQADISGAVGLATMSFGMGFNITPIETITAVNSIVNGGEYIRPRVVKALADDDGNLVKEFEPTILRQVLSKQTSEEVKHMMEFVTNEGGGYALNIPGYRIGTKTGTAQKIVDGKYSSSHVVCSMVAAAPMDDPKFIVLVVVDDPEGGGFGSTIAAPVVREITEELLRYMNIRPTLSDGQKAEDQVTKVAVPKVKGMTTTEAKAILEASGLKCSLQSVSGSRGFKVVAQYPKNGEYIEPGGFVYLYDR